MSTRSSASSNSSAKSSKSSKSCTGKVCPITIKTEAEMEKGTKFKVCVDPSIYDVDALYEWVFRQNKTFYPHNRVPIPETDIDRLKRMYKKLHPNSPSPSDVTQRSNSRSSSSRNSSDRNSSDRNSSDRNSSDRRSHDDALNLEEPVTSDDMVGERRFQFARGNPAFVIRTVQNMAKYFVKYFLQRERWERPINYNDRPVVRIEDNRSIFEIHKIMDVAVGYHSQVSEERFDSGYNLQMLVVCKGQHPSDDSDRFVIIQLITDVGGEGDPDLADYKIDSERLITRPYNAYDGINYQYYNLRINDYMIFGCASYHTELWGPNDYTQDLIRFAERGTIRGGAKITHKYNGRTYKVRTGTRGGKFILVNGDKKYI